MCFSNEISYHLASATPFEHRGLSVFHPVIIDLLS